MVMNMKESHNYSDNIIVMIEMTVKYLSIYGVNLSH